MLKSMLAAFHLTQSQRHAMRQEIDLFEATQAHLAWKMRLQDYLAGRSAEHLHPHHICLDNRCNLGLWIHGHGRERFLDQPLFMQLMETHAKFHYHASKVVEAHQAGNIDLAQHIFNESFSAYSRKTIACLAKLNTEVEGNPFAPEDY